MYIVINMFMLNMVVLDLILVFLNVFLNFVRYIMYEWILGDFLCNLFNYFLMVFVYVCFFILIVIVLDRYCVFFYFFYLRIIKKKCLIVMFFIWIFLFMFVIFYGVFIEVRYVDIFVV